MHKNNISICIAAMLCVVVLYARGAVQLMPGSVLHSGEASRSGWIWNADEKIRNGGESYYRLAFDLEDEAVDASFVIRFDDSGHFHLNGKRVAPSVAWDTESGHQKGPSSFAKSLVKGRNVLAVYDRNGAAQAGMIFLGEIRLKNRKIVRLHSDRTV